MQVSSQHSAGVGVLKGARRARGRHGQKGAGRIGMNQVGSAGQRAAGQGGRNQAGKRGVSLCVGAFVLPGLQAGASRRWGGWPAAVCRAVRWPSGGTGQWGRRVSVSHCISMRAVSRGDSRVDDTGCGAAREAGAGGAGASTRARARAAAWRRAAATEGRGCMVARTRGSSEHLEEAGGPARQVGGCEVR